MKRLLAAVLGITLLVVAVVAWWWVRPRIVEEDVQMSVVSTIQREAPASFYITGTLDLTTSVTVSNTKYLLPESLRLSLGTTRSTVRVPGRVSYGFDVRRLRPEDIQLLPDGVVEVRLPELEVFSVEPLLEDAEVQTDVGWARLHSSSGQRVEQEALTRIRDVLRRQAEAHLERAAQPRIHTARGLRLLLAPPLEAAGVASPRFRFQVGTDLVMEPAG